MTSRRLAKISLALAILLMVAGIIGFVGTLTLNAFVLDKFNAYGEVPIPGSGTIHLPAGDATISFHTVTVGTVSGGGLPVPELGVDIDPPQGVAQPKLTENYGGTTTVNNDAHRRVWLMQVPAEGDYKISTEGQVNGFISPQLAFGHGGTASSGNLVWIFVGLFVVGDVNQCFMRRPDGGIDPRSGPPYGTGASRCRHRHRATRLIGAAGGRDTANCTNDDN